MERQMQLILLLLFGLCGSLVSAQVLETPANSSCKGVLMQYALGSVKKISPFLPIAQASKQPYAFSSSLTLSNLGFNEVKNWQASIRFQHDEWLVEAPGIVLASGESLPAQIGNNETVFLGFPQTDLQNAVETAGDPNKTSLVLKLTGTEFGVNASGFPLPANISFPVDGYTCGSIAKIGSSLLQLCCSENATANATAADIFLPLEQGDITIEYNVVQTMKGSYWAQVFISNDNLLGRMDGWNLTWEWKQGEFIKQIRGAQVLEQDQSVCLNGPAGVFYPDEDFSQVVSCLTKPTMMDLPIWFTNDTNIGMVPGCCRSGLLLPKVMDPSQSKSSFKLLVYKVPPNMDRLSLVPPASFDIGPKYSCGHPRLIAPVDIPDPSNKDRMLAAVKSWQVTCNLTDIGRGRVPLLAITDEPASTGCCVSFSGFYNASVVPCPTCSCGCPSNWTCSPETPAMLIPTSQLLTPAVNRTPALVEWSRINRMPVPRTLPCPDNCGVNINWHVATDFRNGWSARISILNWGETIPDWFAAVEMDRAMPGFKEMFTLNGTVLEEMNNTLYIQGKHKYNDYLLAVGNETHYPGTLQAVMTFDKKKTPGINVTAGDGFPSRVVFNGQECRLPLLLPSSGVRFLPSLQTSVVLAGLVSVLVLFV